MCLIDIRQRGLIMRKSYDEPVCTDLDDEYCEDTDMDIIEEIKRLIQNEYFAVLSTQGEIQPYASIISFCATEDLKILYLLLHDRPENSVF